MASKWRGFCRRCGGEIGPDGLYCAGCQAEETSAQMLDDMMRQRDETVSENARLTALLAERDAEIKALVEAGNELADAVAWNGVQTDGIGAWADEQLSGSQRRHLMGLMAKRAGGYEASLRRWRAALAARGGEVQG